MLNSTMGNGAQFVMILGTTMMLGNYNIAFIFKIVYIYVCKFLSQSVLYITCVYKRMTRIVEASAWSVCSLIVLSPV